MKQRIYSAIAAISAVILTVLTLTRYESIGVLYCIVFALIFGFSAIVLAGYAIDGTKVADWLANMFACEDE